MTNLKKYMVYMDDGRDCFIRTLTHVTNIAEN